MSLLGQPARRARRSGFTTDTAGRPSHRHHDSSRRRRRHHRLRARLRRARPLLLVLAGLAALGAVVILSELSKVRGDLEGARLALLDARAAVAETRTDDALAALDRAEARLRAAGRGASAFPMDLVGGVPVLGSPARAADDVSEAGLAIVAAGRLLAEEAAAFPTSGGTAIDGHDLSEVYVAAGRARDAVAEAAAQLGRAAAILEGPTGAALPPVSSAARDLAAEVDSALGQLDGAGRGLALLRDLSAPDASATLLVVSQTAAELRATGGLIGSYGVVEFERGTVRLDRYEGVDSLQRPEPLMDPPPVLDLALPDVWMINNSNWWPDYPTSAATIAEMFRRQGGGEVDGVLAVTEFAMGRLIDAIGPIQVPGYTEPVTGAAFPERALYEVEIKEPRDVPRKKFLIELSKIVFNRVFALPADQVPAVVDAIDAAVGQGDLQLWFADPARQELVAGTAWDGALPRPGQRDFLMLVDTNMTASKANQGLRRDAYYRVQRDPDGRLIATLDVRYRNEAEGDVLNPLYNGHLRVYVPRDARLRDAAEIVSDAGVAPDGPYRVFAVNVAVVPEGETRVRITYELPDSVAPGSDYRLTWMRQSGTPADTLTADVGGEVVRSDGTRVLDLSTDLPRNRVREWLHDRWLGEKLGF